MALPANSQQPAQQPAKASQSQPKPAKASQSQPPIDTTGGLILIQVLQVLDLVVIVLLGA
jgi:hypothetical protein